MHLPAGKYGDIVSVQGGKVKKNLKLLRLLLMAGIIKDSPRRKGRKDLTTKKRSHHEGHEGHEEKIIKR